MKKDDAASVVEKVGQLLEQGKISEKDAKDLLKSEADNLLNRAQEGSLPDYNTEPVPE